jgi:hypothetical protein
MLDLRREVPVVLDDELRPPSEIADRLDVGRGFGWYQVALTLERFANDGLVEVKGSGNGHKFRRRQP